MHETISINIKFAIGGERDHSFRYAHAYEHQSRDGRQRLLIAPRERHAELLAALAVCLPEPLRIVYVLVAPMIEGHEAGRYESPDLALFDVQGLLREHRQFLESDGRHHLWVFSPDDDGLLVYDRHEVLYAYGRIEEYERVLKEWSLKTTPVAIPYPHWHVFHPEFHSKERAMLSRFVWARTPLHDEDSQ